MWNDLKRYRQLSFVHKRLLLEALAALAIAQITMACIPFRRIAAWLGIPGAENPVTVTIESARTAKEVGWAVCALGHRVPWDGRCLAQALAATWMLRCRGIEGTVSIGVRENDSAGFDAHAWLRVGDQVITGGTCHEHFKVFTTFARRRA